MRNQLIVLIAAMTVFSGPVLADDQPVVIDSTSERVLTEACHYLRSATKFSVNVAAEYEDVLLDGTRVTYHKTDAVALERPDKLRVDVSDDKGVRSLFVQPDRIVVYRPAEGIYAEFESTGSLEARLTRAEELGITFPLDDLLHEKPCRDLVARMQSAVYAGRHVLDGEPVHHLLISTDHIDMQLWIDGDDSPEVVKVSIYYRDRPGEPRYTARLTDWVIETPDQNPFTFNAPAGAKKLDFLAPDARKGGE